MLKKTVIIFFLYLFTGISTNAAEIPIIVTPVKKITTSSKMLQEGDIVEFKVLKGSSNFKEGEILTGLITSLKPNGFWGEHASIVIDNFRLKEKNINLKGTLYAHGNRHKKAAEYTEVLMIIGMNFIRGGEVVLKPEKNKFTLYLEN